MGLINRGTIGIVGNTFTFNYVWLLDVYLGQGIGHQVQGVQVFSKPLLGLYVELLKRWASDMLGAASTAARLPTDVCPTFDAVQQ